VKNDNGADNPPELDAAILAYLVGRGFTRSVKAFEKEAEVKPGDAGKLESVWNT
jgi:hypothetical protein